MSFEENIKITKQCVDYARSVNPDILVEGELGFIGMSSKVLDNIPAFTKTRGVVRKLVGDFIGMEHEVTDGIPI
ncbi:MAG: Tagatose-bisphosphate aldolase [Microgenomates group bacterium GW2011_GWA2_44_7]|nr:MAG: Tagatose-bisphosphate aldolase [Microgenomates group bacterium GW2011_GWA2_44_7]